MNSKETSKTLKQLLIKNDFTSTDLTLQIVEEWLTQKRQEYKAKCAYKAQNKPCEKCDWIDITIDKLLEELQK